MTAQQKRERRQARHAAQHFVEHRVMPLWLRVKLTPAQVRAAARVITDRIAAQSRVAN
jgi:hypothetical protein